MDYLARCSYMLQQGNFVGDILYFYGDSAPNFVPPKSADPNFIHGYDYDYINAEILVNRLDVLNGRLILPHGQEYALLVLPDSRFMSIEVIRKIEDLILKGAIVTGPRPEGTDGLFGHIAGSEQVKEIADRIWGKCNGITILENNYGTGKIIWGKSVPQILKENGIIPDFQAEVGANKTDLDFIHRRTNEADIYFIRNTNLKPVHFEAIFRISNSMPEIWDPLTGKTTDCPLFTGTADQTRVPIDLGASGSVFVVFTSPPGIHMTGLNINNNIAFPANDEKISNLQNDQYDRSNDLYQGWFPVLFNDKWITSGSATYDAVLNNGSKTGMITSPLPEAVELKGPWLVTFGKDKFAPDSVIFDSLVSWSNSPVPGIQYFSGIASYHKTFELDDSFIPDKPERKLKQTVILDLGNLQEVAEVNVNGNNAGIVWTHPYMVDITGYVKRGKNSLDIEVANVWTNRLCGDAKLPPEERISKTNITRLPNAWSYPMVSIPNDEYGLRESGLLGPVIIKFYNTPAFKDL